MDKRVTYIINTLKKDHRATYDSIAVDLNMSKQRVHQLLKEYAPEIIKQRKEAKQVFCSCGKIGSKDHYLNLCQKCYDKRQTKRKTQWAFKYNLDACKECGQTKQKHKGHGLCSTCHTKWSYYNIPGRRETHIAATRNWQLNNPEKVKEISKKASYTYWHSEKGHKKMLELSKKKYKQLMSTPEGRAKLAEYNRKKYINRKLKKAN